MYNETTKEIEKLNKLMSDMPAFCKDFFIGMENISTLKTLIGYAYDLSTFFYYIKSEMNITDITLKYLDTLKAGDLEMFLHWSSSYIDENEKERTNGIKSKSRKLSTLRSFYNYFLRTGKINTNPALLVLQPKIRKKEIIRLEHEETRDLIKKVTTGENLSARQKKFAEKTHYRDIAIIILLLNTGIRVSECVGIDLNDINFELKSIKILRKGMKEQIIYFSDDVEQTLKDYIDLERKHLLLNNENEDALFISLKHCRISARSVENLVKKFASGVSAKNITPHKLRSTYGTALYNKTGDISLVASVLGHTNVNTTKAYYSETTQERIKDAMTKKPY